MRWYMERNESVERKVVVGQVWLMLKRMRNVVVHLERFLSKYGEEYQQNWVENIPQLRIGWN